jgi:hypothetical protein
VDHSQNLQLLDELCFDTLFERKRHLVDAMLQEIVRLAQEGVGRSHSCRCAECTGCEPPTPGHIISMGAATVPPQPEPASCVDVGADGVDLV